VVVGFGGSRSLVKSPLVAQVVAAVLARGSSVRVGCCVGADQLVVSAVLAAGAGASLVVCAAFGPDSGGSCPVSSIAGVKAAASAGASVTWWAGGGPAVPLAGRLASRSKAVFAGCSVAVFFAPGSGSLLAAAGAATRQIPVFVFAAVQPPSLPGCPGSWVASSFVGFPAWQWTPAQASLF